MAPIILTAGQQTLIDCLAAGPMTRRELMLACGYGQSDPAGRRYVSVNLVRLARRGYRVHSIGRPGSHRGVLYVLTGACDSAGAGFLCQRCGTALAADHRGAVTCSPCERALSELELAALA